MAVESQQYPYHTEPFSVTYQENRQLQTKVIQQRVSETYADPNGIEYEVMEYDETQLMSRALALKIKESGHHYDLIISLKRGGAYVGRIVSSELELPHYELGCRLTNTEQIEARKEAATRQLEIYAPLPPDLDLRGQRVLLIDDVNHTSATSKQVKAYLQGLGVSSIDFAVLHEKPTFRDQEARADFVVRETDAWIAYPWEYLGNDEIGHSLGEFFKLKLNEWIDAYIEAGNTDTLPLSEMMFYFLNFGFEEEDLPMNLGSVHHSLEQEEVFFQSLQELVDKRYPGRFNVRALLAEEETLPSPLLPSDES